MMVVTITMNMGLMMVMMITTVTTIITLITTITSIFIIANFNNKNGTINSKQIFKGTLMSLILSRATTGKVTPQKKKKKKKGRESQSKIKNSLPSAVFPASFNLPSFKRQVYHHLRDQMGIFFYYSF